MEQELYELPEGWALHELHELCQVEIGRTPPRSKPYLFKGDIPWATIADLRDESITETKEKLTAEAVKKHQHKLVKNGTLLMSFKLTLGKLAFAGCDLFTNEAIAALSIKEPQELYGRYLFYVLQFIDLEGDVDNAVKGKTLNKKKLAVLKIPLPPLDALFTRIDTATTRLQETLELTKALFASALDEMFSPERRQDESVPLNQAAIVARGKSKHRPRNDKSLFGGDYPFIQTGDVRNAKKYITTHSSTYNERGLAQSKLWTRGTICLTIAANIGDVAILGMDSCFPDSVVGITSESESNEYIYYFLMTLQRHLDSKANAAAQKNINLRILSEIEIPLPSVEEQNHIVTHLDALSERTRALEAATEEKLNDLTALKASLLDAAFKGQL